MPVAAEHPREVRGELEGEHRLDIVLADQAIAHAGDAAARYSELLAGGRMYLLRRGDRRRRQTERIAISECNAGSRVTPMLGWSEPIGRRLIGERR